MPDMVASFGAVSNLFKGKANMSTSLLTHAYGLTGYQYVRTADTEDQVCFTIRLARRRLRGPVCGSLAACSSSGTP